MTHNPNPRALRFSQQVQRVPPQVAGGGDEDPADVTRIRKAHPAAIGAHPQASKFADQLRTTMSRRLDPVLERVPKCLRLLPPDLLDRWQDKKPHLLDRLNRELTAGELGAVYETLQELLYDTPRVAGLLNDVFLAEAYRQLPAEAKAAMPATSLKAVMPGEALPAFADLVDNLKGGDGKGCAEAMAELGDLAPAAERLVASKLKTIIPPPPQHETTATPPELKRSVPNVQVAFTPPPAASPAPLMTPDVPDDVPAWLFAMGLAKPWQRFMAACAARRWDAAWQGAEQLAMQVAERDPEHPELAHLAESMAMSVAEGLHLDLAPELASLIGADDLLPVLMTGSTTPLMACNDALLARDWVRALEQLDRIGDEAQMPRLIELVLTMAWRHVPPAYVAAAVVADLVALWSPGAGPGLRTFIERLRAGDRRGADEALRGLAAVGTSGTKIALIRAKLGWQSTTGTGRLSPPGTGRLSPPGFGRR